MGRSPSPTAIIEFTRKILSGRYVEYVRLETFQANEQPGVVKFFAIAVVADVVEFIVKNILLRRGDRRAKRHPSCDAPAADDWRRFSKLSLISIHIRAVPRETCNPPDAHRSCSIRAMENFVESDAENLLEENSRRRGPAALPRRCAARDRYMDFAASQFASVDRTAFSVRLPLMFRPLAGDHFRDNGCSPLLVMIFQKARAKWLWSRDWRTDAFEPRLHVCIAHCVVERLIVGKGKSQIDEFRLRSQCKPPARRIRLRALALFQSKILCGRRSAIQKMRLQLFRKCR